MNKVTDETIKQFKDFITGHNFFYVVGHKEPDGDCICSCLGVSEILKAYGKPYELLSAGPFKRIEIQQYEELFSSEMEFLTENERRETGLIICDCSELRRIGDIDGDLKNLDTFIIDHHKTSDCPEGALSLLDPTAPAACVLVQILYEQVVGKLTKEVAETLFFGLMTDTGFFRFLSSNDSDILVAASRLVEAGADPRKTYDRITYGKSYNTRKLLGVILSHAEKYLDGKLIVAYETQEDTRKYGQDGRDSDLLYQSLLAIKGVEAVVFIRQDTDQTCTAGFRSKDKVDVSLIASKFGGGGHKNASGLCTEGRLNTLIPSIVKEFARIM